MEMDFHIITRETAFVLRTFFFIVFGLTINLSSLVDVQVLIISIMVFVGILMVSSIAPQRICKRSLLCCRVRCPKRVDNHSTLLQHSNGIS